MIFRTLFLVALLGRVALTPGQKSAPPDSLAGRWIIQHYYSPTRHSDIESLTPDICKNFLLLDITGNKIRCVFTDSKDTVVFRGKIRTNGNRFRIKIRIHDSVYLGELENCISPGQRGDISMALYRTFGFRVKNNQLTLYYNFPGNASRVEELVFARRPG